MKKDQSDYENEIAMLAERAALLEQILGNGGYLPPKPQLSEDPVDIIVNHAKLSIHVKALEKVSRDRYAESKAAASQNQISDSPASPDAPSLPSSQPAPVPSNTGSETLEHSSESATALRGVSIECYVFKNLETQRCSTASRAESIPHVAASEGKSKVNWTDECNRAKAIPDTNKDGKNAPGTYPQDH